MSCGCKGHYHDGGCPDQNVLFWDLGRAPVKPTKNEIRAQEQRNFARHPRDKQAEIARQVVQGAVVLRPQKFKCQA